MLTVMKKVAVDVVVPSPLAAGDDRNAGAVARATEAAGLDGIWFEDHLLAGGTLARSSTVQAGAAAAATDRINVGLGVFVPGLRPLAWAACDILTLTELAGNRFQLGIGAGAGPQHEWDMAGAIRAQRWQLRDDFVDMLGPLTQGRKVIVSDADMALWAEGEIYPPPTLWLAGRAGEASHNGAGWIPALVTPSELAAGAKHFPRRHPITVVVRAALGAFRQPAAKAALKSCSTALRWRYGLDKERASELAVGGTSEDVAGQLAPYVAAGATRIAVVLDGGLHPWGIERLAEVRSLLHA